MNLQMEISVKMVSKDVDPEDPEKTIDTSTESEPVVYEGEQLADFLEHYVARHSSTHEPGTDYTAQEIQDILMNRPVGEMKDGLWNQARQGSEKHPGLPREQANEAFGKNKLQALLAKAKEKD